MNWTHRKALYLPAVFIIAAVVLMLAFIAVSTVRNLDREKRHTVRMVHRQGEALLAAVAAGMPIDLSGTRGITVCVKGLLEAIATSDGIAYAGVGDARGQAVLHYGAGRPAAFTTSHPVEIEKERLGSRMGTTPEGLRVIQIEKVLDGDPLKAEALPAGARNGAGPYRLFVGILLTDYEASRMADLQHAFIMGGIVLVLGMGTLFFIYVIQNYYTVDRALERTKEIARQSEKLAAVGQLAAGVAHEVRNPMSAIRGFAQFLVHALRDRPEDREYAAVIVSEIDRINRVVSDLLSFAGPGSAEPEPTDVGRLVSHVIRLAEADALQAEIAIDPVIGDGVGTVALDAHQITQALLNLIQNALHFTAAGGRIIVCARVADQGRQLQLAVEDEGPGIPKEHLSALFDPFFTTRNTGTGLGLAIAYKVAENHGGFIDVASPPPGKRNGTRFTLCIPVAADT